MHKIEVQFSQNLARFAVSLFTREWIEIQILRTGLRFFWSPSLRGSGLKFFVPRVFPSGRSLPLYEEVD